MDIRDWLDHTADCEPLDASDAHGLVDDIPPQRTGEGDRHRYAKLPIPTFDSGSRGQQSRGRLDGTIARYEDAQARLDAATYQRKRRRLNENASALLSNANDNYARRARRKTRHDKYAPKSKKRRGDRASHRERKSNPKHAEARSCYDESHTGAQAQRFLPNYSGSSRRLTVGPLKVLYI